MRLITLLFVLLFSTNLFAGDEQKVKQGLVERFTSGLSEAVENILDGEGDTQVRIDMGEDYKPEFSIVTSWNDLFRPRSDTGNNANEDH